MNKIVKLTESDLVRLVKRVIKEQQANNKSFWDEYSIKMANFLKGKTFKIVANTDRNDKIGKNYIPIIKFVGYLDRSHRQDDKPLNSVSEWGMMMSVIILKANGLPNAKDGQKAEISIDFGYKGGVMTGVTSCTLYDDNTTFIAELKGLASEDFGGFQKWSLPIGGTT